MCVEYALQIKLLCIIVTELFENKTPSNGFVLHNHTCSRVNKAQGQKALLYPCGNIK